MRLFSKNLYYKSPNLVDLINIFNSSIKNTLESEFKIRYNTHQVFSFMSARSALYFLLKNLNFKKQSNILVCGFTCEVVPAAIIYAGYIPKYLDINLDTLGIDKNIFLQTNLSNTKAVIIQHTFGISGIYDEILDYCKNNNIFIIEDCSLAIFSKRNNILLGSFGDAAIFSFEISKTINAIRGGVLIINNTKLDYSIDYSLIPITPFLARIQLFLQVLFSYILYNNYFHIVTKYFLYILYKIKLFRKSTSDLEYLVIMPKNYINKMPFFLKKFILSQLKREIKIVNKNSIIKNYYLSNINKNFIYPNSITNSNYLIRFPIFVNNKIELISIFKKNGYEIGSWFNSPLSSINLNFYKFHYFSNSCPNSEFISNKIINLPMHNKLTYSDLKVIIDIINKYGN